MDPTELRELRAEIDREIAEGKLVEPAKLRQEYVLYANCNRGLILDFSRRVRLILGVLVATTLIAGGFSVVLIVRDSERSKEAKALATEVKSSRYRSLLLNCEEQNARHEAAYNTLGLLVGVAQDHADNQAERKGIHTGNDAAKALIDALVPFRSDCAAYAKERSQ